MAGTQNDRAFRLEDIEAALTRAAARARKIAAEAGRPIVLCENGKVVKKYVSDEKKYVSDERPASQPSDAA